MTEFQHLNQVINPEAADAVGEANFISQLTKLECDPDRGIPWVKARKFLESLDWENVFEAIQADEKMRQMFQWADKNWDGYVDFKFPLYGEQKSFNNEKQS